MANIQDFKTALSGGGARANHFEVNINIPTDINGASRDLSFLCNSASLPASTITEIPVMYQGRSVHVAGERVFGDWSIQVYNDIYFNIRNSFELWSESILNTTQTNGTLTPAFYSINMSVTQLDRNGDPVKTYDFHNAFPTAIGDIALSYNAGGEIESFPVTFVYDYWTTRDTYRAAIESSDVVDLIVGGAIGGAIRGVGKAIGL